MIVRAAIYVINTFFEKRAKLRAEARQPARLLAYAGSLLAALLLVTPLVTGTGDHLFTRIGFALLAVLLLASLPLLASAAVGCLVLFGRFYVVGDRVSFGADEEGEVASQDLFAVHLRQGDNFLRVPHIVTLWRPIKRQRDQKPK